MTMFCGVRALQPDGVDEDIEGDRQRQQRRGRQIHRQRHHHDRGDRRAPRRRPAPRPAPCGPPASGACACGVINASMSRVVPHVEGAGGTGADGDTEHRDGRSTGCRWPGATTSPAKPVNTTRLITRGFKQRQEIAHARARGRFRRGKAEIDGSDRTRGTLLNAPARSVVGLRRQSAAVRRRRCGTVPATGSSTPASWRPRPTGWRPTWRRARANRTPSR